MKFSNCGLYLLTVSNTEQRRLGQKKSNSLFVVPNGEQKV